VADHAITDSDGGTVGEITPASAARRTRARIGTAENAPRAGVATVVSEASAAVKAVSVVKVPELRAARVAAEAVATEVAHVTVRPSVAAIVTDRVARVATSRARDLTRVRVAIRTAGPIKRDASIKARDPIRRPGEIRTGARTQLPVLTRTAALIRRGDSTPAKAAPIKVDDSNRDRATNRAGALSKTVDRTKALYATT
jgi:hypothetical protein